MTNTLKFWGWGYEGEGLDESETRALLARFADGYGLHPTDDGAFPTLDEITLATPRLTPPAGLAKICTTDKYQRVLHAFVQPQPDWSRPAWDRFRG